MALKLMPVKKLVKMNLGRARQPVLTEEERVAKLEKMVKGMRAKLDRKA